jgi:para-aminobenzoate synthetase/4-amino-4-deoxychorismate lyase
MTILGEATGTATHAPRPGHAEAGPGVERRVVLDGVSRSDVLRGITASPGLVVLSGTWAGGGLIVAQQPQRIVSLVAELPDVFGSIAIDGANAAPVGGIVGGGWFGWLGYPLEAAADGSCWFGFYPNVIRYSSLEQTWYDEAMVADTGIADRREQAVETIRLAATQSAATRAGYRVGSFKANTSAGEYTSAVERCIDRIRAGDVYQANICLRLQADFSGEAAALFADLVESLDPAYAGLVCGPDFTIVSLSPELFLRRSGREVVSAPIKGTMPRSADAGIDRQAELLGRSDKDRAENVMIVDLVRNDLARVAVTGTVSVPSLLQVKPHCGVWHLVSRVAARLRDDVTDLALLDATFPPGSVTGAPKLAARRIIGDLEHSPRGVYTGAVGYVSPTAGLELNVAIRTLEIRDEVDQRRVALGVGAGITAGSTPIREWWECLDKAAPLMAVMSTRVVCDAIKACAHSGRERSGVFETMLVLDGQVVELDAHLERLSRSASQLWGADLRPGLADDLARCAREISMPAARLRLQVTPGASGQASTQLTAAQVPRPSPMISQLGLRLRTAAVDNGIGSHKWVERTVVDELEARHRDQQVLITDHGGHCLETTRGNIIVFRGRSLITPPLDGRILPGTTRRVVLDIAAELGLVIEIRAVTVDELSSSDGLAVSGSLTGLSWVRWCPVRVWKAPTQIMINLSAALRARWTLTAG